MQFQSRVSVAAACVGKRNAVFVAELDCVRPNESFSRRVSAADAGREVAGQRVSMKDSASFEDAHLS